MSALFDLPQAASQTASQTAQSPKPRRGRLDPAALLDGLKPRQHDAVVHSGSPLLIVAGAGSGKTRVLAHRIAYLLAAGNVHPGEIIALNFTHKAAGEMQAR